jgi:hypothetical protein
MKAKVTIPFNTETQRFRVGDEVSSDQVGDVLFYTCTDAKKKAPDKPKKQESPPPQPKNLEEKPAA